MDYVISALLALVLVALLGGLYLIRREYLAVRAEVQESVESLFRLGPDGVAPIPAMLMNVGKGMAGELKASLSGAMMGHASAMSKQLQAIEGDVAVDTAEQGSPLLSLLTGISPSLRRRLAKNPMAAMAASALASKFGGHGGPVAAGAPAPRRDGHSRRGLSVP